MFTSLLKRDESPPNWQKIPWDDPDFSRRMLREHLTQDHDGASRRLKTIERHIDWINHMVLGGEQASILDLGCGPGLYTGRMADFGHACTGIDIAPASIDYARANFPGTYHLGDVREFDYGSDYDLVCMIYGELNAFAPEDAARILDKAHAALKPGGKLLLEVHPRAVVEKLGKQPPTWYSTESGLFSDDAYICLQETAFTNDRAITRYHIIDAATGKLTQYTNMLQAYTVEQYKHLLRAFDEITLFPALLEDSAKSDLGVILAYKR